ncbi:MAG: phosphoadenosine phosphosulfate reductase family protein [Desulfobacteraceae bacterium]|nr:phosphoadenosine phosphosulfate reductase family protein [Desulfobacteraceae bacterium]
MLSVKKQIKKSIKILKMFEPSDGYYLAFSGGKDSIVLHDLAEEAGVKFKAHYNITTADPPEVINFIRENYPEVSMDRPGTTMWKLIPKKLMPPTRMVRYCCGPLKEKYEEGLVILTGNKRSDSYGRRNMVVKSCQKKGTIVVHPILDWNDNEIWYYIKHNDMLYCCLYDEGFKRLGCVGCPMAGPKQQRIEFERWPKYKEAYLRAFQRMLTERKRRGKKTDWKKPEEVMKWWLKEK